MGRVQDTLGVTGMVWVPPAVSNAASLEMSCCVEYAGHTMCILTFVLLVAYAPLSIRTPTAPGGGAGRTSTCTVAVSVAPVALVTLTRICLAPTVENVANA